MGVAGEIFMFAVAVLFVALLSREEGILCVCLRGGRKGDGEKGKKGEREKGKGKGEREESVKGKREEK
jgi:hypothetical protein